MKKIDVDQYVMEFSIPVAGFPTHHVMGIRPDGSGNVTDSHVAWHSMEAKAYVPSPVVVGKFLYIADDRGTANCFDTATGEELWAAQTPAAAHATPMTYAVDGRQYVVVAAGSHMFINARTINDYIVAYALPE